MNTIFGNFPEKIIPNLKDAIIKFTLSGKDSEMSLQDLSNNLPSSGGGGTNPTSAFIPFNNSGTFADSYLINDIGNNVLKSQVSGNDIGLKFDFANAQYILGNSINGDSAAIFIDGLQGSILGYEANSGSNGLNVTPKNGNVSLGDFGATGNQTIFELNNQSSLITTKHQGNDKGLKFDFENGEYYLGDFTSDSNSYISLDTANGISIGDYFLHLNGTYLSINDTTQTIKTFRGNVNRGLNLDFADRIYSFGQITGGNATLLQINDVDQTMVVSNSLTSTSSGSGLSGKSIKVRIGSTDYLIPLQDV